MVKLQFHGTVNSMDNNYLEVFATEKQEILINIQNSLNEFDMNFISLDKETAIKLSKEIRKQISLID
jgi:hypothetical protein